MFSYCVDLLLCECAIPACVSWYHLLQVTVRESTAGPCDGGVTRVEDRTTGAVHIRTGQQLGCEVAIRLPHSVLELWAVT